MGFGTANPPGSKHSRGPESDGTFDGADFLKWRRGESPTNADARAPAARAKLPPKMARRASIAKVGPQPTATINAAFLQEVKEANEAQEVHLTTVVRLCANASIAEQQRSQLRSALIGLRDDMKKGFRCAKEPVG